MARDKRRASGGVSRAELEKRGWVPVADSEIEGWEEGKTVVGRFVKMKQGQFGPLLVLDDGTRTRVLGVPTILATKLEGMREGDGVYIECLGQRVQEKSGRAAWTFDVMSKRTAQETQGQEQIPF